LALRARLLSAARVAGLLLTAVALGSPPSYGQPLRQYAHTTWRFQEGVFDASPISIAQTKDGFLWIGTLNGLIRFDGVHFESWNDRLHELHTCCELSLLGSRDGSLWIGTSVGLVKLSGGKLSAVTNGDGRYNSMIEDRKGRIWAARSRIRDNKGPLCEVEGTHVQCHGATLARQQVEGHFGLPGMRERAAIVKGRLDVRSTVGRGTEIELSVPAATAYRPSARASWWSRLWRGAAGPSAIVPRQ
jgi:Two component regulator propeller